MAEPNEAVIRRSVDAFIALASADIRTRLRAYWPEQPFDRMGDETCDHPSGSIVMNGFRQICGRCGKRRDAGGVD